MKLGASAIYAAVFASLSLIMVEAKQFDLRGSSMVAALREQQRMLQSTPTVTKLVLIDTVTDQIVAGFDPLVSTIPIDLSTLTSTAFSIEAITTGPVGSVRFSHGPSFARTENSARWAMCTNSGNDFVACSQLIEGFDQVITATPYSGANLGGTMGTPLSVRVRIIRTPPAPAATTAFTLINSVTDTSLGLMTNATVVNLAQTPKINIRADVTPAVLVGSVRFTYDGPVFKIENTAVYAFNGNNGNDYFDFTPTVGCHVVTATAFTGKNATGSALSYAAIRFCVVTGGASPAPSQRPSSSPSKKPSAKPSAAPSKTPSAKPSTKPSAAPSKTPSAKPSTKPSAAPSKTPSAKPSTKPSAAPSKTPSAKPSAVPSKPPVKPGPFIHDVQGSGSTVVAPGVTVTVTGIATSIITNNDVLDGFYLQEEDADADGNIQTSEGIFVFCRGRCTPSNVNPGDKIRVTGKPREFTVSDIFPTSAIAVNDTSSSYAIISSNNPLPTPVPISLPALTSTKIKSTFERFEGMVVTFPGTMVVSEYFQLARFGELVLTETSRPYQFTHLNVPSVGGYAAFQDTLATRVIVLDDDNNNQNDAVTGPSFNEAYAYPEGGLSLTNKFRGGDTIVGLTGVLGYSFGAWRLRPIPQVYDYTFQPANPPPLTPSPVGGNLKVSAFNVLNYFTTVDNGPDICGPTGGQDCRGADSPVEFAQQRAKIVSALVQLNADIFGLIELENAATDGPLIDLVSALNAQLGSGVYQYIPTGPIGTDAIRVGLIYKTASVAPYLPFKIMNSSINPLFIDTRNRPSLIQTFQTTATGARLTIAVNHLKSKGSACTGDPDIFDGQGNCRITRANAATALASYLATDPTGSNDPDFMIIGDLNAYAKEDAITALESAGYVNLVNAFAGPTSYSYVFDGQLGYLDHALATPSLAAQVTGVTEWHINADECPIFDYNDGVQTAGEQSFERESITPGFPLYNPDPYRSSDHDPVLVGFNLVPPLPPPMAPVAPPMAPVSPPMAPVTPPMAPVTPPMAPVAPPMAPVAPPIAPVSPPMAPVAPPMAPVTPPMAPVAPPMAPVTPPIVPVAPPMAPVSPPMAPVSPPMAPVTPPIAPVAPPMAPVTPPTSLPPIGDIVINEIMKDPTAIVDANGEWFELYNKGTSSVNLAGWIVKDLGTNTFTINSPLIMPPNTYAVLGRNGNTATNGGITLQFTYNGNVFALGNDADEIILVDTLGREQDRVAYDFGANRQFPDPVGASLALISPLLDNSVGAHWCTATTPYGPGDKGTPGLPNDCPPQ